MNFKDIFLFKNLDNKDIDEIKNFTIIKKLKKNDVVFYEKDKSDYLHLLVDGVVKVYKIDNKGNELIIHKIHAPSLIAELANFENIPFPANCSMESDGTVLKIEFEKFKKFLKKGDVCLSVMSSLLKKMRYLDGIIQDNLILDTTTKIAKFIYDNPNAFEDLKQHSIATLLNIKPETLSRKIKKLKDLGIIEKKENKFFVKDREKIKEHFTW
jgi:CRP-like cAMP-binding protein